MKIKTLQISPIRRDVAIPSRSMALWGEITKAIQEMKPGDYREFVNGNCRSVASAVLTAAKRFKYGITTRKVDGVGVGAWRIK